MEKFISKDAIVAEIKRQILAIDNTPKITDTQISVLSGNKVILIKLLLFLDTLETKEMDLTGKSRYETKTNWCPSKKQIESLNDLLEYNIGVFNYQKFMEVNSLYEDLTKILDYGADRQK